MARKSRRQRVKKTRETRQAAFYLILTISIIIALFFWGLPTLARFAGLFVPNEDVFVEQESSIPPTPPILVTPPEATSSSRLNFEGFANSGVEVVLYLNNTEEETVITDSQGRFSFKQIALNLGENSIYAISKSGDKESEKSKTYHINVDREDPDINIEEPKDGSSYSGDSQRTVRFVGSVSDDVVRVTVGDRVAIVSPDGSFSVSYQLSEGTHDVAVRAEDKAGNSSEVTLSLTWNP